MATYARTISRTIKDLISPEMGDPFGGGTNTNPSSINDLGNQFLAIKEAGLCASSGIGSNTAGLIQPLVGDYGTNFTHSAPMSTAIEIGIPWGVSKYSICIYAKSLNPTHYLSARLYKDGIGQFLFQNQSTVQLGTGARPSMHTGNLAIGIANTNPLGGVEKATLWLDANKSALAGTFSQGTHFYWDGILSYSLEFF